MKAGTAHYQIARRKFSSAWLFLLAVLVITVSCPVKRFLHAQAGMQPATQKEVRAGTEYSNSADYRYASCANIQQHPIQASSSVVIRILQTPAFDETIQAGFNISYYLSRIRSVIELPAQERISPLPLFLQHQRMLV